MNFLKTQIKKISGIVVAIGVNDAAKNMPASYLEKWKKQYAQMIDLALQINQNLAISTILPIEGESNTFDSALIDKMNNSIRQISKTKGIQLIDMNKQFDGSNLSGKYTYTLDGVHLNASAYKVFGRKLLLGLKKRCKT